MSISLGLPVAMSAAFFLALYAGACREPGEVDRPGRAAHVAATTATTSSEPAGACSQADRREQIHEPNAKFVSYVQTCSKSTWASKEKNVACLAKAVPSLSEECAGCFADMASCALANCKLPCMMSSTSERCTKCANQHCQASLIRCTGVARADLP